ncbi:MAG: hypothetical protein ABDH31_01355 [Chlorobiota bacterium]
MKRGLLRTCVLAGLVGLTGCPSENPLLVDPPRTADSLLVVFLSLVPDGQLRRVELGDTSVVLLPGERSAALFVSRDSLALRVWREERTTVHFPLRLLRRMLHLVVVSSTADGKDTAALFLQPLGSLEGGSTVRLINMVPAAQEYTLRIGCPNAPSVAKSAQWLSETGPLTLTVGREVALSVTVASGAGERVVGTWRLSPRPGAAYSFFVWGGPASPSVGIAEDTRLTAHRLWEPDRITQATVALRVLNLASQPVTVVRNPQGSVVEPEIGPSRVGPYRDVPVCGDVQPDSFLVRTPSGAQLVLSASLEPFRRYTLVLTDSAERLLGQLVMTDERPTGAVRLRIFHAAAGNGAVEIATGARGEGQLLGGQLLASGVVLGEACEGAMVPAGSLPLLVWSSALPRTLLAAAITRVMEGRAGFLCLLPATGGDTGARLAWVDDTDEEQAVVPLPNGIPMQLLQGLPGQGVALSAAPVFNEVAVPYRTVVTTVLPSQGATLSALGHQWTVTGAGMDSLLLLVLAEAEGRAQLFRFASPRRWGVAWGAQWRFINGSDLAAIDVFSDTIVEGRIAERLLFQGLQRGTATPFELIPREYRLGVRIRDSGSRTFVARADNVLFPVGYRYSVIFVGNRRNGYGLVFLQEL